MERAGGTALALSRFRGRLEAAAPPFAAGHWLVLFLANKAGGAHIERAIEPRYFALTRLNSSGWGWGRGEDGSTYLTVPAGPDYTPLGNPTPANVRQIAHEVQRTCEQFLSGGR